MRTLFGSIASLLMMLVVGCTTVDPDECWVNNTSGGFGDDGPIPIGAGVGATSSGDFGTPPAAEPLAAGGTENPCMAPEGIVIVDFDPSEFPFVTTVQDDGTGPAGGWQVAKANLEFQDRVVPKSIRTWYCGLTIEMPLRNHAYGKISASRAAGFSVDVTESVARAMHNDYKLPEGIFCSKFLAGVQAAFPSKYPKLGERVTK